MPYASRVPPTLLVAEYHHLFFLDPSPQEAVPCRPNPCLVEAGKKKDAPKNGNGATLGFEEKLWQAADKLRGSLDAAEYKHVVLGLIFLKYISDAFEERRRNVPLL